MKPPWESLRLPYGRKTRINRAQAASPPARSTGRGCALADQHPATFFRTLGAFGEGMRFELVIDLDDPVAIAIDRLCNCACDRGPEHNQFGVALPQSGDDSPWNVARLHAQAPPESEEIIK